MAFQKFNVGDTHYIADTKEDLKLLPAATMGSTCYVIENASKYMINSKGEWICQTTVSSSGDAGESDKPNSGSGLSAEEIAALYISKEEAKLKELKSIKYEATLLPKNTLIDYREKEIRIMCPKDTQWTSQSVGENGNPNMHYFAFKAYAPEGAYSFKEDDLEVIEDQTMYYFEDNDFAGIDEYGRKYSIVWLAAAVLNNDIWTYFGEKSTDSKMIGWYYSVEWYNKDKELIGMDKIRINLTNEECHSTIEPYYIAELHTATWGNL